MSRYSYLFCVFLCCAKVCQCSVWEFGVDHRNTAVIVHNRGSMSEGQVQKTIPVKVPKCQKVKYVRVEVLNDETTPKVTFGKKSKIITIDYITEPNTGSQYEIVVKGVQDHACVDTKPETHRKVTTETTAQSYYTGKLLPASYRVSYI